MSRNELHCNANKAIEQEKLSQQETKEMTTGAMSSLTHSRGAACFMLVGHVPGLAWGQLLDSGKLQSSDALTLEWR